MILHDLRKTMFGLDFDIGHHILDKKHKYVYKKTNTWTKIFKIQPKMYNEQYSSLIKSVNFHLMVTQTVMYDVYNGIHMSDVNIQAIKVSKNKF